MRYIYCHPLFDERKCAHRFSYQLAKVFEKNGLCLERFDYRGTGEGGGEFCDVTMESLREDIERVVDGGRVCLIGTRLGAAAAFEFCGQSKTAVDKLIMIEPIVNGQDYVRYLFRKQHLKNMMTGNGSDFAEEGFCNLEGYKTSDTLIDQIKGIELVGASGKMKSTRAVCIVQISAGSRMNPEYELVTERLKKNDIRSHAVWVNAPVFWERIPISDYSIVTEKIAGWLR